MTKDQTIEVKVTQKFSATAERVFDAWLKPDMLNKWMFGRALRDEEVIHLKLEPKVGGRFSFMVKRQGEEIDHVGTYREIVRPNRLVFSWGIAGFSDNENESIVFIDIIPNKNGCELTLTHELDAKWAEYKDRSKEGWTKMLGALDDLLD